MSLGIAFKGPEGIVLAVDSRVTLTAQLPGGLTVPASFDNAVKLLGVPSQPDVGMVTYGQGAIGQREPRTAHSYLPELEAQIADGGRLSVEAFAKVVSEFYLARWRDAQMPKDADGMYFLVAGFDEGAAYGRVFTVDLPGNPVPAEQLKDDFGLRWGGQSDIAQRMLAGFDNGAIDIAKRALNLSVRQTDELTKELTAGLWLPIPFPFLPLQDCVDLAVFLVKATATLQQWMLSLRGVGGPIDVATITRTDGFRAVQAKTVQANTY